MMFNVGIIGAHPKIALPTAKLTSRALPPYYDGQFFYYQIAFWSYGQLSVGGDYIPINGEWLTKGTGSDFEIYASGGAGWYGAQRHVWLSLATTREWFVISDGTYFDSLTIQIRRASDKVIVASAIYELG